MDPPLSPHELVSLDDWLSQVEEGRFVSAFPSDDARDTYLDSISGRSETEVRELLRRLLVPTGSLGIDEIRRMSLDYFESTDPQTYQRMMEMEYYRRLTNVDGTGEPPWQGLSWVLDLLPRWPMKAIEVLEAYFLAHMMDLPDGRMVGIGDAQAVIRAMWIGNPRSGLEKRALVYQMGPQRFEHLVEALYTAMGFATRMTPRSADGGRDIEVGRTALGSAEQSLVECKLWARPVGVTTLRALLGAVANERATKGILVTASTFTRPARQLAQSDPRLEILSWDELLTLLDEHLGADWGMWIDKYLANSLQRTGE